jgi:hypothetical protein
MGLGAASEGCNLKIRSDLVRFGMLCFLFFWFISFMYLLLMTKPEDLFSSIDGQGVVSISDFLHYYQAATITLSDQRHLVYDPAVQMACMNRLISPRHIDTVFYFQCLPYTCPIVAPLALLSKEIAYLVWVTLSVLCGCAGVFFINKLRPQPEQFDKIDLGLILLGVMTSAPSIITFKLGQSSWFLVGLYSFFFWALRRQRPVFAGALLAISTFKPQYAVLMAMPLLGLKQWRALAACVAVEVAQLVLAGLTIGWENVWGYPQILVRAETDPNLIGVFPEQMVSLRNLLSVFGNQRLTLGINTLCLLAAAVFAFFLWRKIGLHLATATTDDGRARADLLFNWGACLTLTLALLLSPHTHVYDLVVLACVAVLSLPTWSAFKNAKAMSAAEVVWSLLLVTFPVSSWVFFATPLSFNHKSLACLLLLLSGFGILRLKKLF